MNSETTELLEGFVSTLGTAISFVLAIIIFYIVVIVLLYKKCNKPGWAAIIPYYNSWVKCEMVGAHWLIFVFGMSSSILSILSISNGTLATVAFLLTIFSNIVLYVNLAKKFHKGVGFTIGLILLGIVFLPILVFSKDCIYDENAEVKNCGFFNI